MLYPIHLSADPSEPVPPIPELPAIEAVDPVAAATKLLSEDTTPRPDSRWAGVVLSTYPSGCVRGIVWFPLVMKSGGLAIDWSNPRGPITVSHYGTKPAREF
jgi:hypothetical protein